VLREAFDYPYRQISHLLGLTEANARQLVARARGHLFSQRRNPVNAGEKRRFVDAFVAAAETGELAMLEELLAMDVARHSDHGRRRRAAPIPLIRRAGASTLPASSTGSRRQRPGGQTRVLTGALERASEVHRALEARTAPSKTVLAVSDDS
jgi:hypothetical protein